LKRLKNFSTASSQNSKKVEARKSMGDGSLTGADAALVNQLETMGLGELNVPARHLDPAFSIISLSVSISTPVPVGHLL